MGHYSINKQNGSTHLIGRSFDNDTVTGEKTSHADIFVYVLTPPYLDAVDG